MEFINSLFSILLFIEPYIMVGIGIVLGSWLDFTPKFAFQRYQNNFEAAHSKSLAELNSKLDQISSRNIRLDGTQIDVVDEVWQSLNDAHISVQVLANPLKWVPDFRNNSETRLKYILKNQNFDDITISEIFQNKNAEERSRTYQIYHRQQELLSAKEEMRRSFLLIKTKSIYINKDIENGFRDFWKSMDSLVSRIEISEYNGEVFNTLSPLKEDVEPKYEKLKTDLKSWLKE